MKRILHITGSLRRNGTETFIMNLFRNVDKDKFVFDFLICYPTSDGCEQEARDLGAKIYYYTPRRMSWCGHRKSLNEFFRNHAHEYDAVHYNGNSFSEVLPVSLAKKYGIPVRVMHSHNSMTYGLHNILFHKWNSRRLSKIATDFLACSENARRWGYGGTKCFGESRVIPNGINMEDNAYNPAFRQEIRQSLDIADEALVIVHTGGFRAVKNQPFLLEVFKEIKKRQPEAYLLLCGAGEEKEKIERLVRENCLEEYVKILGIRKDVNKILSAADAYVFPSFYEGLPFALVEAQASGLPVFASDTISDEINLTRGYMALPLTMSAADWAENILSNVSKRLPVEENERLRRYDIKETCRLMETIYSGV